MARRSDKRRREPVKPTLGVSSKEDGLSRVRAQRVFEDSDDEPQKLDDGDEEIDSDEAFGSDDDFDMGTIEKDADLEDGDDYDEEEEEEGGEDMVALSTLLDEAPEDAEEELADGAGDDADDVFGDQDWDAVWSRKRTHAEEDDKPHKRMAQSERTEVAHESTDAAGSMGMKLGLDELLKHGTGASISQVQALAQKRNQKQPTASKRNGGVLHAPLPSLVQDRLDRQEAYKLSKEEVEGWVPTIKRIREADHLSFPLQPQAQPPAASNAGLIASFTPTTDMEQSVAALLEQGGLSEKQVTEQEDLALRAMDPAEASRRQANLRRMRELMFRAEQKARRANKIKSKTYRRIHRRERERLKQEQIKANGIDDSEDDDDLRYQAAKDRAKERATLRHKNTGKWAKLHAGRHDDASAETRLAVEEQLRRGDELRKKIHGDDSADEDEDDVSLLSERDDDREAAFDELESFARREAAQDARDAEELEKIGKKSKGLMHMKFMKDARERQARDTQEMIKGLREDITHAGSDDDGKALEQKSMPGRAMYSKGTRGNVSDVPLATSTRPLNPFRTGAPNPWLQGEASSSTSKQKPQVMVGKDSGAATRSVHRTERHSAKSSDARALAADDAEVAIDPSAQLEAAAIPASSEESESDAEPIEVTRHARGKRGRGKRHATQDIQMQRDLVAEAFAGDDVALEFAHEKRATVQADAPREEDTTLPGWGSWGGKGVRHKPKKNPAFVKKMAGLDPTRRKDFGMDHVIMNERLDKKATKYKAKDLPFPYTSAAQYEAAMRTPIGPEWNTRTQHQRMTMPRVTTKMGQRIDPIRTYFWLLTSRTEILSLGTDHT